MTRDEATALFERVYTKLRTVVPQRIISLVCTITAGMWGKTEHWHIVVADGYNLHVQINNEEDWQQFKRAHAILETDQDLEEYADAARVEAESEEQMMEVVVRCTHCMHVCKQWEHPTEIVFISSTLMKYAEMACEQCSQVGMEIAVLCHDLSGHGHDAELRSERE